MNPYRCHIAVRLFTVLSVFFLCGPVWAQEEQTKSNLRTPDEILKMMEKSNLNYNLQTGSPGVVPELLDSADVLTDQLYLRRDQDSYTLTVFNLNDEARKEFFKAEENFADGKLDKALKRYRKVYELDPGYHKINTLIGDVFFEKQQYDSAAAYYTKSIERNYADYQAHWFLADALRKQGRMERAVEEMTIAHLLNRNHDVLFDELKEFRTDAGRPWKDWTFLPEYRLARDGDTVTIEASEEWLGYAMVKAVWAYEPSSRDDTRINPNDPINWIEEKEALISYLAQENTGAIRQIVVDGNIDYFLLYELIARRNPRIPLLISKENLLQLVEYVNRYH